MINKVILVGRVGADATVSANERSPLVFPVATWENIRDSETGQWESLTTWHDINYWPPTGSREAFLEKLKKGAVVYIEGRIEKHMWEAETGERRVRFRIKARVVRVLSSFFTASNMENVARVEEPKPADAVEDAAVEELDEELPF